MQILNISNISYSCILAGPGTSGHTPQGTLGHTDTMVTTDHVTPSHILLSCLSTTARLSNEHCVDIYFNIKSQSCGKLESEGRRPTRLMDMSVAGSGPAALDTVIHTLSEIRYLHQPMFHLLWHQDMSLLLSSPRPPWPAVSYYLCIIIVQLLWHQDISLHLSSPPAPPCR